MAPSTAKFKTSERVISDGEETEDDTANMIPANFHQPTAGYTNPKPPSASTMDKGRFVVSPVHFHTEKQPLLRIDSQTSDFALSPNREEKELLSPISILVSDHKVRSGVSLGDDEFVESLLGRCRHASSVSKVSDAATIDTFLDEDEPQRPHLTLNIPNPVEAQEKLEKDHLFIDADGTMPCQSQPYYDNAALNFIPSPSENPYHNNSTSTEFPPEVIYARAPPVILTSHGSDTSLSHGHPPESVQVSTWDIGPASRNPDIQFYVGSCLSVTSATSAVSFFNTLYAHGYMPICRICHQPASEKRPLTSPCKCVGSLRFVHQSCLMRWIDTRSRQLRHSPKCELCGYQFRARRTWRAWKSIAWPVIPLRDKILHGIFISSILLMCVCVGVISKVFKKDNSAERGESAKEKAGLTETEVATLSCGVLFFVSFFAAMVAQIKANWSLWKLTRLFFEANYVLQIERERSSSAAAAEKIVLKA